MTSPAVDGVRAALRAAGVQTEPRTFSETVPTAAAAAIVLGCEVGAIANSLVFAVDDEPLLVLASGAHRVDTEKLAGRLGCGRIRRASPEFVLEHTGQEVGGVAPVGHPTRLRSVVDVELSASSRFCGRAAATSTRCSRRASTSCSRSREGPPSRWLDGARCSATPPTTSATPAISAALGSWARTTIPITVAVAGSSDTISAYVARGEPRERELVGDVGDHRRADADADAGEQRAAGRRPPASAAAARRSA